MPRAFNGGSQFALVFGTDTGLTTWFNTAVFVYKPPQRFMLFVINLFFVYAKSAVTWPPKTGAVAAPLTVAA